MVSESNNNNQSDKIANLPQIYGAFIISLGSLILGTLLGYPTIALPQWENESQVWNLNASMLLYEKGLWRVPKVMTTISSSHLEIEDWKNEINTEMRLDDNQSSIFVSILWMAGIICSPLGGILSCWLGRKKVVMIAAPFVAVGWLVIGFAQNKVMLLYIGRILSGAGVMTYSASITPYISETVHPKIRGRLVIIPAFMMAIGLLLTWILGFKTSMGYVTTWRITAYLLTIPPILLSVLIFSLPESPYWLIERNNIKAAKKSLQFFRGEFYDVTEELAEIQQKCESKKNSQSNGKSWKSILRRMCSSAFLKPFVCVGVLLGVDPWLGFNPLLTYTFRILEDAGSNIDHSIGLLIIGSVRIAFAGAASVFVSKFQPRILYVFGTLGTALCMALIGTFVFLEKSYPDLQHIEKFSWIPLLSVIGVVVIRSVCILPVLMSLSSEVFPTEIRTQSNGLVQAFEMVSGAICLSLFPIQEKFMGLHGLLFFYGVLGIFSCFWGLRKIPDNRGKSLVEVEEMYENDVDETKL